jgi:Uma2 family endonuclease
MGFAVGGDDLYEVIDGKRITKGPQTVLAAWTAGQLGVQLATYTKSNDLGWVVIKALFELHAPSTLSRRPDVAFVSYERWPKNRPISQTTDAWDVVPNVVAEVVSPSDISQQMDARIAEYFRAGVELVWLVFPNEREVHVYDSLTQIRILADTDILDAGHVLTGFRVPLSELSGHESNG